MRPEFTLAEYAIVWHLHLLQEVVGLYSDVVSSSCDLVLPLRIAEVYQFVLVSDQSIYIEESIATCPHFVILTHRLHTTNLVRALFYSVNLNDIFLLFFIEDDLLENELSNKSCNELVEFVIHHV